MSEEAKAPKEDVWSFSEIVKHTGLKAGEVTQAVKDGYVWSTVKGRYKPVVTLVNLIKWQKAKFGTLPVYENLQLASAATGIPIGVVKAARLKSHAHIKGSRVHLALILPELVREEKDWRAIREQCEAESAQIDLAKKRDLMLDREKVGAAIRRAVSGWWFAYDRLAELELPPALKGCTEEQVREGLVEAGDRLKATLEEQLV